MFHYQLKHIWTRNCRPMIYWAIGRTKLEIRTICVNLTFDLVTWKWYMTHRSLMGCISATYEANRSELPSHGTDTPKIWTTRVTLTVHLLTWKWYVTHRSLMGCINTTYEANLSHGNMKRTRPTIQATHMTLPFDQLTRKRYATHRSFMGCISDSYEVDPSNSRQAMERTRLKIRTTRVTLTFDL